jgi:uncharacterized cupin superfamily protein
MEKIAIEDVEVRNNPLGVHGEGRPVSGALGTEHVAMNFFRLQPGESFSGGLHTRHDQEELFSVESGTATFEVGRERDTRPAGEPRAEPAGRDATRERETVDAGG